MELADRLGRFDIDSSAQKKIVEAVELEATQLRLFLDGGYPWETVSAELKNMVISWPDAPFWQYLLTCVRLVPGMFMPARAYYRYKQKLTRSGLYQAFRRKCLPFPVPGHIDRQERRA